MPSIIDRDHGLSCTARLLQRNFYEIAIKGGTWERLEQVLSRYHAGGLQKLRAAEEIAQHMEPDRNRSKSFQVFRDALRDLFD